MSALGERGLLGAVVLVGVMLPAGGLWLARTTGDPHWLNRAGSLMVCLESMLALLEFARRARLARAEEEMPGNPYLKEEVARAEGQIIRIALTMAVVGEFLHGFGDLLIRGIIRH